MIDKEEAATKRRCKKPLLLRLYIGEVPARKAAFNGGGGGRSCFRAFNVFEVNHVDLHRSIDDQLKIRLYSSHRSIEQAKINDQIADSMRNEQPYSRDLSPREHLRT